MSRTSCKQHVLVKWSPKSDKLFYCTACGNIVDYVPNSNKRTDELIREFQLLENDNVAFEKEVEEILKICRCDFLLGRKAVFINENSYPSIKRNFTLFIQELEKNSYKFEEKRILHSPSCLLLDGTCKTMCYVHYVIKPK